MRSLTLLLLLSFVLFAAGCGTWVSATQLNPPPRALVPRGYESVEVFSSAPPARPHVDLAMLDVNQVNTLVEDQVGLMIQRLREQAGAMGCDAVFLGARQERAAADLFSSGSRTMSATCIVYRQPGDVAPAAPSPPARRTCADRKDFDAHRDCILAIGAR